MYNNHITINVINNLVMMKPMMMMMMMMRMMKMIVKMMMIKMRVIIAMQVADLTSLTSAESLNFFPIAIENSYYVLSIKRTYKLWISLLSILSYAI